MEILVETGSKDQSHWGEGGVHGKGPIYDKTSLVFTKQLIETDNGQIVVVSAGFYLVLIIEWNGLP